MLSGEWVGQSLCLLFLGHWMNILGPGAWLWGDTEFNRATAHSGPTFLARNRLPTAVTTSPQVALETFLRQGTWCTVAQQQVVPSLPPSSEATALWPPTGTRKSCCEG